MFGLRAFEKPDAIGEESEVESDDEAAVGDDALFAKSGADDRVAKEGGVVEDEGKLSLSGERFLPKVLIEDKF